MNSLPLKIAVVLATHNGQGTLSELLDGYKKLNSTPSNWELVIVDNGSTDKTAYILSSYVSSLPLRIITETRPGKNRALNSVLRSYEHFPELIIFTDDDAVPDPDFLSSWAQVAKAKTEYNLFGGTVNLKFRETEAIWQGLQKYEAHFSEIYARNIRAQDCEINADAIFGPNMAVRGSVFRSGFTFDENIGPNSGEALYPMGSETEFCTRVARETDCRSWFATAPQVQHIVRDWQMTPEFIQKRAYRHGKGTGARHMLSGQVTGSWLSITKLQLKQLHRQMKSVLGSETANWDFHWNRGYGDALNSGVRRANA